MTLAVRDGDGDAPGLVQFCPRYRLTVEIVSVSVVNTSLIEVTC